jgi:hypothetical protein
MFFLCFSEKYIYGSFCDEGKLVVKANSNIVELYRALGNFILRNTIEVYVSSTFLPSIQILTIVEAKIAFRDKSSVRPKRPVRRFRKIFKS